MGAAESFPDFGAPHREISKKIKISNTFEFIYSYATIWWYKMLHDIHYFDILISIACHNRQQKGFS